MSTPLYAFPAFCTRPASDDGTATVDVVGPGGSPVGRVLVGGGYVAHVGSDTGPRRPTELSAAEDVVMLHIAVHGLPQETPQPYASAQEARLALTLVTLQREELMESAARAFFFHALRQPHVAAVMDGLDTVRREFGGAGTRTESRRTARLLHLVSEPATALLTEATSDVREWMAFPLARLLTFTKLAQARLEATAACPPEDMTGRFLSPRAAVDALDTLHRIEREMQSTAPALPRPPRDLAGALTAVEKAAKKLPNGHRDRPAGSALACHITAEQLRALEEAAQAVTAGDDAGPATVGFLTARQELMALAVDIRERLHATALVLEDAKRHGSVRVITDTIARAEIGPVGPDGSRRVRYGARDIGPVRRTRRGQWTGPLITDPYQSPEGAIAALVDAHVASEASDRTN